MKKIKFLMVLMLFLFLGVIYTNAQNKTTFTESYDFEGIMTCTDDYVWGVETIVETHWQSKAQVKWKGDYEGLSGKHYTWSLVVNYNWKNYVEGQAYTENYVSNSVIECEGIPIAIYKIRYHFTLNANGEVVLERYRDSGDDWICL